jgi:PST family polysaccharide transporter
VTVVVPSEIAQAPSPARVTTRRSLLQGLAWTGGAKWSSQILTWLATLVVARILTPDDYGLIGMASIFLGLVALVNEFGLGTAIVTLRDLSDDQVAQLNTVAILFGAVAFVISCLMAVPLAHFFRAADLHLVIAVMSTTFLITAFRVVPYGALEKDLRFAWLALIEAGQAAVQALGMVTLAMAGFGYWTLALGGVLGAVFSAGVACAVRPAPFAWPQWRSLQAALRFSRHIVVARLSWYAYSNADFLVAGRMLGQAALGVYTMATSLGSVPVDKVGALVMRVTPAFFSAVQSDRAALRRYLLALTEGLAIVTFPAALGLTLVADEFVLLVLGEKWRGVVPALQLLAPYSAFRSIVTLLPPLLNVTHETRFSMRNGLLAAMVLPMAFYVGSSWGIGGIAAAWIIVHPLVSFPLYWRVFDKVDLSLRDYIRTLWPAVSGSAVMLLTVVAVREALPSAWSLAPRLGAEVAAGAVAYLLCVLVFYRARVAAVQDVLRERRA